MCCWQFQLLLYFSGGSKLKLICTDSQWNTWPREKHVQIYKMAKMSASLYWSHNIFSSNQLKNKSLPIRTFASCVWQVNSLLGLIDTSSDQPKYQYLSRPKYKFCPANYQFLPTQLKSTLVSISDQHIFNYI